MKRYNSCNNNTKDNGNSDNNTKDNGNSDNNNINNITNNNNRKQRNIKRYALLFSTLLYGTHIHCYSITGLSYSDQCDIINNREPLSIRCKEMDKRVEELNKKKWQGLSGVDDKNVEGSNDVVDNDKVVKNILTEEEKKKQEICSILRYKNGSKIDTDITYEQLYNEILKGSIVAIDKEIKKIKEGEEGCGVQACV